MGILKSNTKKFKNRVKKAEDEYEENRSRVMPKIKGYSPETNTIKTKRIKRKK